MKKHKTRYSLTIVFALLTFGILAVSVLLAATNGAFVLMLLGSTYWVAIWPFCASFSTS